MRPFQIIAAITLLAVLTCPCRAAAELLHVAGGRLAGGDASGQGRCTSGLGWERDGSTWSLRNDGGDLRISLKLDVLGSGTPYFQRLDLTQYDDGTVRVELTVAATAQPPVLCWSLDADCYADVEGLALPFGGHLRDALSRFAGGQPPVDLGRLRAQLSGAERQPSLLVSILVAAMASDDWRTREGASSLLAGCPDGYPELRHMLRRSELTPEQQSRISRILTPRDVPDAVLAMGRVTLDQQSRR